MIRLNYDNPHVPVERLIEKELSLRKSESIRRKRLIKHDIINTR